MWQRSSVCKARQRKRSLQLSSLAHREEIRRERKGWRIIWVQVSRDPIYESHIEAHKKDLNPTDESERAPQITWAAVTANICRALIWCQI